MSTPEVVDIKTDEIFENLPRAPIVEAVIEVRARATQTLEESSLRSVLEPKLVGYSFLDSRRGFHGEVKIEGGKPPIQKVKELGWMGVSFRSTDSKHIAQFKRDGFVFSRLEAGPMRRATPSRKPDRTFKRRFNSSTTRTARWLKKPCVASLDESPEWNV